MINVVDVLGADMERAIREINDIIEFEVAIAKVSNNNNFDTLRQLCHSNICKNERLSS